MKNLRLFLLVLFICLTFGKGANLVEASVSPSFNTIRGDQEFLQARIAGQNRSFSDPLEVHDGDEVEVKAYYHNTGVDTIARNTLITITLPTEKGTTHTILGTIKSKRTTPVYGTIVNGKEVGISGLTLTSKQVTVLSFIPGSVHWFPNRATLDSLGYILPNKQNGDTIVTSGLSLGDIPGDFQYAGVVTFHLKVTVPPASTKAVLTAIVDTRKASTSNPFTIKNSFTPGDQVEYRTTIQNTDDTVPAQNIAVRTILPVGIYFKGPVIVHLSDGTSATLPGVIDASKTIVLHPPLKPHESLQITYLVESDQNLKTGICTVNKVIVSSSTAVSEVESSAQVCFSDATTTSSVAALPASKDTQVPGWAWSLMALVTVVLGTLGYIKRSA